MGPMVGATPKGGQPSAPEPEGMSGGSPSRPTIAEYTWTTGPTDRFVLPPPSAGICHAAILARTTRNSKSKHDYETKEILFGLKDSVRKRKLPIAKGEKRIIETTVYYDPLYRAPDVRFDIDTASFGVFEDEAGKVRKHRTSNKPGVPPGLGNRLERLSRSSSLNSSSGRSVECSIQTTRGSIWGCCARSASSRRCTNPPSPCRR